MNYTELLNGGGVVVWITNDATIQGSESCSSFIHALTFKLAGFNVHDTMIWYKDSFSFPDPTRYRQCFEYMFVFSKGKPKSIHLISDRQNKCAGIRVHGTSRLPDGTTFRKSNDKKSLVKNIGVRFNVWEMPSEKHNIYGHPAVFPEQLATDHILSWSSEGDLVFDPFCGSGTTCLSAIKNKRQYIGFDISQTYCDIANKRLFSERIFVEGWDCWNKEEK